ncbi:MAG TPA: hypothetical protein VGR06_09720 [Actinophytocola sp.]|jgi:hypothetical protein|uniref:hypothetical protein n=1 Tax=Actinophytocola sp. TaxID=1872138 RepID=UPI002E06A8A8|nr:hypothetical protein [Actinophytocola sp.]
MPDETCTAAAPVSSVRDLACAQGVPVPITPSTLQLKVIQKGWFEAWVTVYDHADNVVCSHERLWLDDEIEMTCPIGDGPFVISGGARFGGYHSLPYSARERRLCVRFDGPFFAAEFKRVDC